MPIEYTHRPLIVADRTAVVIAGRGSRESVRARFAEEGANVVTASRTESSVAETVDEVRKRGGDSLERTCDVTDVASIAALEIYQIRHAADAVDGAGSVRLGVVAAVGGGCARLRLTVLAALIGVGVANDTTVLPFDEFAVIWTSIELLRLSAYHLATMEADARGVGGPEEARRETADAKVGDE